MGYFSLNPFNKIFRLIFRKESKTKLKIRTESSKALFLYYNSKFENGKN